MFEELLADIEGLIVFIWLLGSTGYIFLYQWWYTWFMTGVLPNDTWFVMLLLLLFCFPALAEFVRPGFVGWWYANVQIIHDNILRWLLSDMRPLDFLKWILVGLGLVLYTTVVQ